MYGVASVIEDASIARSARRLAVEVVVAGMPSLTDSMRWRTFSSQPIPSRKLALVPPKTTQSRGARTSSRVQRSTSSSPIMLARPPTVASGR